MDIATGFGLLIGLGAIVLGNTLEDGHLSSLVQFTAGLIVFGGTIGATLVSHKWEDFKLGLRMLKWAFSDSDDQLRTDISKNILEASQVVRKESPLALEKKIKKYKSAYMKNVLRLMIDGVSPEKLQEIYQAEIDLEEDRKLVGAKVWDDAGGFAPTIGILGAVLGLIHVMGNLTNTAELGKGIAVAFVATIYGVGSANLLFLPIANKIRRKIEIDSETKAMIVEGACSIARRDSKIIIEEKMRAYTSRAHV